VSHTAIRKEAHRRASMALDIALKLTGDTRMLRKIARLLLHLDSRAPTTRELASIAGWERLMHKKCGIE
jgi:hypothetical protein